ncbi:bile acid:sodium symporter family protein [Paenibacillus sp. YYML68]|uniref:bile acid:sodium symporter family protein n=1 Tax=Paenibacillus sp. YYML68 TaxID=2909250 RepID=UPI00249347C4|nr:bile acid:sodium symporter [Paenibacillus sp. YYML68]
MEVIRRTNGLLDRWMYIIMPFIMGVGAFSGEQLTGWTGWTPYLFMALTFVSSLNADVRQFADVLRRPALFILFLLTVHAGIPLIIHQLSAALFETTPELITGLTLMALLPLGVTSIFWVAYSMGNLATTLSLVTLNTLLSPLLVPASVRLLLGSTIELDTAALMLSLLKLVLLPTLLGMMTGHWLRERDAVELAKPIASAMSKALLYMIVLLNAAVISGQLSAVEGQLVKLTATVLGAMLFGYGMSLLLGRLLMRDQAGRIAVMYAGGVRNYTVGVVLAAAYFTPLVGLPVLLAMLLQHPVALLFHTLYRNLGRNKP